MRHQRIDQTPQCPHATSSLSQRGRWRGIRFLVYEQDNEIRGFAMLYLRQPTEGSPKSHIPKISDLYVAQRFRSMGIGTSMIARMEELAVAFGHKVMHVDPVDNPRALVLYERLGYVPIDEPQQKQAIFYDEAGNAAERKYWNINLRKQLAS
ncbi:GNAT family N-acetyltransferase [bacterium]|nr:GNAT family N-acetyltransferase [bacterium]